MMIGGARFHSNGFVPAAPHSGRADEMMMATAPNPNAMNGTKRLASCREELERSWAGAGAPQDVHHCVSMTNSNDSDFSEDERGDGNRSKRRRTLSPIVSNDDMMAVTDGSFVTEHRITPDNRPPRPHPQCTSAKAPVQAGWYPPQQQDAPAVVQVKAGWYEGEIDAFGCRHGKGITKHDDGTGYEGQYVNDAMEGTGVYKFVTTRHLVPHPHNSGAHLQRQIEKSFEGTFANDMPQGAGMVITRTVDWAGPQVPGAPFDVPFSEVMYDVGMHRQADGKAVGEGVRIIYTTTNAEGRSTLEKKCFRLTNGEDTKLQVADEYAGWILQCMGVDPPVPSSTT
ncbi:hypothetical protein ACHAXT_011615 [Thalassiosira profunda]